MWVWGVQGTANRNLEFVTLPGWYRNTIVADLGPEYSCPFPVDYAACCDSKGTASISQLSVLEAEYSVDQYQGERCALNAGEGPCFVDRVV